MASSTKKMRIPDPEVIPPYYVRRLLRSFLSPAMLEMLPSLVVESIPSWLKYLVVVLLLANIKSFPLVWHVRVFAPAIWARAIARPSIHPLIPFIRSNKHPTTTPGVPPTLRLDSLPLGRDIFLDKTVMSLRASFDDCDFNGHLSNSAYAKNLDYARMQHLSGRFLRMHFDGGRMALGGSAFTYHAEIPALAKYEIEMSVGAWDDKWFYIVARFMSPSRRSSSSAAASSSGAAGGKGKRSLSTQNLRELMKDVIKPSHEAEAAAKARRAKESITGTDVEDATLGARGGKSQSDRRKLYCTSISRYCFKSGRKTIPPWFIIATSGYGTYASTRANWDKAEQLRRDVFTRASKKHIEQTGRPLPRDNVILGGGVRSAGILAAYEPSLARKRTDEEEQHAEVQEEQGLGSWQDPQSWSLAEWEERRVAGLEALRQLGGVASAQPQRGADIIAEKVQATY